MRVKSNYIGKHKQIYYEGYWYILMMQVSVEMILPVVLFVRYVSWISKAKYYRAFHIH